MTDEASETPEPEPGQKPKRARARKPLSAQELVDRGTARLEKGRKAQAREDFTRATELDPENEQAWLGLLAAARTEAEQREYVGRVLAINPENEQAKQFLATLDRTEAMREEQRRRFEEQ